MNNDSQETLQNNAHFAKKVFVTGGTGLIGSHLIHALLQAGFNVKALKRKQPPSIHAHKRLEWIEGDILDIVSLEEAMKDVDEVYHCAAIVSFSRNDEMFKINIEGTANVVNAAINGGAKKLCFVSSVAALGKGNETKVTEASELNVTANQSKYSASKHRAEMEVWRGIAEGLNAVIVNPSIILGTSNWNTTSTKIFKTAFEEFPYYSDGETGFVDVEDVVNAMLLLMESDISGERFIVSAENKTYRDIFTAIAKCFGKKPPTKKVSSALTNLLWRFEKLKSMFTGNAPLLTKETAEAAQSVRRYDNSKLLKALPSFSYTPINETIERVCKDLKAKYSLD